MTRNQILALEGQELVDAVAKVIFGIKRIDYGEWDTAKEFPYYIPSGKPWRTHQIDAKPLPSFSTFIAPAWQVVEKMIDGGFSCFDLSYAVHLKHKWFARFLFTVDVDEDSAPVAICKAALLAKMEG